MRYGVLGDIHSNLSALESVLAALDREGVDQTLSVGDVVGYGAAPAECIALLRERQVKAVMGNHDAACLQLLDTRYFNNYARAAVDWTRSKLRDADRAWLMSSPLVLHFEHCSLSHGTLFRPELFDYIQSPTDADPSLDVMPLPVCFVGHTHVPVTLLRLHDDPSRTAYTIDTEIDVDEAARALVNVGSVGQPRDEDPRAAYAVYDSELGRVWIKRVEYDIRTEAQRIHDAGLPGMLADRLFLGV
ncbi:MAG: metallophosphoesterase family protein [Planctomycetes bacterium]|jgi:diadenosine tetraphosphatase ApaH/serine/threonine PP2A family protein phosphatase|nr:metallophosphoesterase family protein [Planctomycetota bacterium]